MGSFISVKGRPRTALVFPIGFGAMGLLLGGQALWDLWHGNIGTKFLTGHSWPVQDTPVVDLVLICLMCLTVGGSFIARWLDDNLSPRERLLGDYIDNFTAPSTRLTLFANGTYTWKNNAATRSGRWSFVPGNLVHSGAVEIDGGADEYRIEVSDAATVSLHSEVLVLYRTRH